MVKEGILETFDGKELVTFSWESASPIANLLFHHGLGEHMMRYDQMFTKFSLEGINVCGYDARGHGQTQIRQKGPLGHLGDWGTVKRDIDSLIKLKRNSDYPMFLMGHSMGGLWMAQYALELPSDNFIKGIILSSPAIGECVPIHPVKYWAGRLMAPFLPKLEFPTGINPDLLSRIPEEVNKHKNDKLVHHQISLKTATTLLDLGERIISMEGPMIPSNVLLAHGDCDKITSFPVSQKFFDSMQVKDGCHKESLWINNGYHELHNDLCSKEVIEYYIAWIKRLSSQKK